ncbi:MAG TPA: ABC transporter ATP-binding protein [bacterium]|jgi:ATP-binding cassette subfamily B protein
MKHIRWIWDFWAPHRQWVWILFFMTLLSSLAALIGPFLLSIAIDIGHSLVGKQFKGIEEYPEPILSWILHLEAWIGEPIPENVVEVTRNVIILLAGIGLIRTLAHLYPGFRAMINAKLGMDIRKYYFSKIINKGYRFFDQFRTGDLVTRLTDDVDGWPKIAWFSCSGVFRALESTSQFVFIIAFMLIMDWKLALMSTAPLPVMLYMFYLLRLKLTEYSLKRQQMISTTNDALEAAFSGVRILKAFNGETGQSKNFRKILDERINVELTFQKLWFLMWNSFAAITWVGKIIVFAVGGLMVINGTLTVGKFYAFYVYMDMLLRPLLDIPQLFVTSRTAFACIDREIEIEETPGGTELVFDGTEPVPPHGAFEISNASFKYKDDLYPVLSNITMTVKPGEKAAIVGAVGSGKSTLLKMAAGLYPPSEGEIRYGEKPLHRMNIYGFRERMGYIPQEATLFSESVKDNISFGREIPEGRIIEALDFAQVKEEMEGLPDGLNQVLGQKGLTVSGGQKQRLAIARALAGKPDILLMDDCTSALDAENERRFWQMFTENYPDTACMIVTHRLATARQADVIYVLDRGKIVGQGTHNELIESCEAYQNFLTREELRAAIKSAKSA